MGRDGSATLRQVRQRWNEIVTRVRDGKHRVVVTKHGRPRVAIVPLEDLEILQRYWPDETSV